MKTGAGDDPFADNGDAGEESEDDTLDDHVADGADEGTASDAGERDHSVSTLEGTRVDLVGEPPHAGRDSDRTPWVYTRQNVKEDRDMVQFYLRDFVQATEDDFVDAVADELGTDVTKTDVREAAYVAAMRDPAIVAAELKRWGFEAD